MAKYDNPPTSPGTRLSSDCQELVTVLTEAFRSPDRNAPPVNQKAKDAAKQYREIKAALRTHLEPIPTAATTSSATTATSGTTYNE